MKCHFSDHITQDDNFHDAGRLLPLSCLTYFDEVSSWVEEALVARNWDQPLANSQLETEEFSARALKEMNSANNHVRLEVDPFPTRAIRWDSALAETLILTLWETLEQETQLSYA